MRKFAAFFALAAMSLAAGSSWALDINLTVDSPSVNAGSSVAVNVIWSSTTALNYLSTEFILTAVGSAPVGQVTFANTPIDATSGTPDVPPLNNANYVFYGDSDDFITSSSSNPASVYTTTWAYDTYNMSDSTNSGTDYTQNGTLLWTILNINTTGIAAGQYQITMGNSVFDTAAQAGQTPTLAGGLITINAVPEPSTYAFAAIASAVVAGVARRRKEAYKA